MNDCTLLYRQVSCDWVIDGEFSSQTFKPTRKDNGLLSVYDGDQLTPAESWQHYTTELGHSSDGVVAVTVAECQQQGLTVKAAPKLDHPTHTTIDFTGLTRSRIERIADELKKAANARSWQFRPDPDA